MLVRFVLAVALLFLFAVSPAAALDKGGKSEAERLPADMAQAERLRADMEGQVERLKLNVEKFMEVQDKRIGDLSVYANMNNGLIAFLALGITLAVAVIGFRFPKMAVLEAKKTVDEWVGKEGKQHLDSRFEHFQKEMSEKFAADLKRALADFRTEVAPHLEKVQEGCALVETWRERVGVFDVGLSREEPAGSVSDIVKDPVRLGAALEEVMKVSEAERDFDDWYLLAWTALKENDAATALKYFAKARAAGTTDRLLALKAIFNSGFAASRLERPEEALALYNAALEQWSQGNVQEEGDMVATRAYVRKCMALFQLKRPQDALDAVDEALAQPWNLKDPDIAKGIQVLKFKKGVALQKLKRDAEAEKLYDDFIARNEGAVDDQLQGELVSALLNKALLRRKAKDVAEQKRLLGHIVTRFGAAQDSAHIAKTVARAENLLRELEPETALTKA